MYSHRLMCTFNNDIIQLTNRAIISNLIGSALLVSFILYFLLLLLFVIFFPSCRLAERVRSEKIASDFFIDASHELSLLAWNKGKGNQLTEAPYFCLHRKSNRKSESSTSQRTRWTRKRDDKNSIVHDENNGDGQVDAGCAIYSRSHDDSTTQFHLYSGDMATGTMKPSFVSVVKLFRMTCWIKCVTMFNMRHTPVLSHICVCI